MDVKCCQVLWDAYHSVYTKLMGDYMSKSSELLIF